MLHKPLINIKLYPSQSIHDSKAKHDFYPSQPSYKDNVTKASKPYHRIQIKTLHAINGLTTLTQNKINVGVWLRTLAFELLILEVLALNTFC